MYNKSKQVQTRILTVINGLTIRLYRFVILTFKRMTNNAHRVTVVLKKKNNADQITWNKKDAHQVTLTLNDLD